MDVGCKISEKTQRKIHGYSPFVCLYKYDSFAYELEIVTHQLIVMENYLLFHIPIETIVYKYIHSLVELSLLLLCCLEPVLYSKRQLDYNE